MFFKLITYYLPFNLYLFWTMEMMLDKLQIRAIFLSEFKMGLTAVENTHNKTTHLAQKLHW